MNYAELKIVAAELPAEQIEPTLRQLMMDRRFAVVLRVLSDHRDGLVQTASAPATAAHASSGQIMAHCLGGVDALIAIEARLHGVLEE